MRGMRLVRTPHFFLFFFNDTATTEIYTLSLHDALPILRFTVAASQASLTSAVARARSIVTMVEPKKPAVSCEPSERTDARDRKSTRLNSSHSQISYAVFCLKKKKKKKKKHNQLAHNKYR